MGAFRLFLVAILCITGCTYDWPDPRGAELDAGGQDQDEDANAQVQADGGARIDSGDRRDGGPINPIPDAGLNEGCVPRRFYADMDGDGRGDDSDTVEACDAPTGYVEKAGDCDDQCDTCFDGHTESCDGLDNNCNDVVDESCPCTAGESRACGHDQGACQAGTQLCQSGAWSDCQDAVSPTDETCDGVDNDCDGETDEDLDRACATEYAGTGICRAGTETCEDGEWGSCVGAVEPAQETCDTQMHDENCDGSGNEGCACQNGDDRPCPGGTNQGECQAGTQACDAGTWDSCQGRMGPADEVCDGLDNDCDGRVDEGVTRQCATTHDGIGICRAGTEACTDNTWGACQGAIEPATEICDAQIQDEDCDGTANEGCACQNGDVRPCPGGTNQGECQTGTQTCASGSWSGCQGAVGPTEEVCDGLDNDCDGQDDELTETDPDNNCGTCGNACQSGFSCVSDICRPTCSPSCSLGAACTDSDDCTSGSCRDGTCRPACSGSCETGEHCVADNDCSSGRCHAQDQICLDVCPAITVRSGDELSGWEHCEVVDGNLTLRTEDVETIGSDAFPYLKTITGELVLDGSHFGLHLRHVTLSSVESLHGGISFGTGESALQTLRLPSLTQMGTQATPAGMSGTYNLEVIEFPKLRTIWGDMLPFTALSLTSLDLPSLETVHGDMGLTVHELTSLDLRNLETVHGSFTLTGARYLTYIRLDSLSQVDGSLGLHDLHSLYWSQISWLDDPDIVDGGRAFIEIGCCYPRDNYNCSGSSSDYNCSP